jgi:putative tryptophan/tyrosine transport system substrate-binding protein
MARRTFIKVVADWCGGMAAFGSAMPVIGFLSTDSPDLYADQLRAFRHGLKEAGFIEGENLAI